MRPKPEHIRGTHYPAVSEKEAKQVKNDIMKYVKYVLLANRDKEQYELPWQQLLKPEVLGFPFEFLRPDEDKRVTKGSQILEAAAVANADRTA